MNRDGATISLWQDTVTETHFRRSEPENTTFDVLIAGGGITGVTTALLLQKRGKKCIIAEAKNLCFGTTGGTTSHINTFFDTDYATIQQKFGEEAARLVAKATTQARDLFQQHVSEYNIDCGFEEKDGYVYAVDDQQAAQLDDMYRAAKEAGVAVDYVDEIPVPFSFQKAIAYRRQAQIHPTRYVKALALAFEQAGGVVLENCLVEHVTKQDDHLQVKTAQGSINARHVVYATHIPPHIDLMDFLNAPYRSYAIAVTLNNNAYPGGLAYDMFDPYHYYRSQTIDGTPYLIVGGEDHKTGHVVNTDACFNNLIAHTRKHFDVDAVTHRWSSQYFEPAGGLAYIGHLPGHPENVWVATGFGGNGITYSHIAAPTLADLITGGQSEFADLFNPGRVKPAAGFKNFISENADVVAQFVGKRLGMDKLQALADIAPGEGKLVKYEGESVALYKDEGGALYALNPVCTHAKCLVEWNGAEKSWDCPCHGSRFNLQGEVMTGPAHRPLEKIQIENTGQ